MKIAHLSCIKILRTYAILFSKLIHEDFITNIPSNTLKNNPWELRWSKIKTCSPTAKGGGVTGKNRRNNMQ